MRVIHLNNIQYMYNNIKQTGENGQLFWNSRDLSSAMGYSEYSKFKRVLEKAIPVCLENGNKIEDHFAQASDMIQTGKGASREVTNYHLSGYACLLIAMQADGKKEGVKAAREYFSGKIENSQNIDIRENADIIFYSNPEGNLRIELTFDGETFWTTQKRMADIFSVEVQTINYHLSEIFSY